MHLTLYAVNLKNVLTFLLTLLRLVRLEFFLISDLSSDVLVVPVGEIQSKVVAYPELPNFSHMLQ